MQQMFATAKRPFYQSTQILNINAIERESYFCFTSSHFSRANKCLKAEIFNNIYDRFDGHTWYVQSLLNRIYGYSAELNDNIINYAIEQILSEYEYTYNDLLKSYSQGAARLLKAIAREGAVKELLNGYFITKHKLRAASSVSSSAKKTYR